MAGAFLLAALLSWRGSCAEPATVEGVMAGGQDTAAIEELRGDLQSDPAAEDALARRIARSRLSGMVSQAQDPKARLADIRAWIEKDPQSAAMIGVGLYEDDRTGSRKNEARLAHRDLRHMVENPNSEKGVFGRLKKASRDSKLLKLDEIAPEEKSERVKTLFEGKGGAGEQVLTQEDRGGAGAMGVAGAGLYDRLSAANVTGYSPQVQAIQSALNQRRAPGAPRLIETGKLDYPTLSYPIYGMRYDLASLERRLRYEENRELAQTLGLGGRYSPEQLASEEISKELAQKAGGQRSERFSRRRKILDKIRAAAAGFAASAQAARDPAKITRELLAALGEKEREAARWITVASLEEELDAIAAEENFLTPELLAAIAAAPAAASDKELYRKRGLELADRLAHLKSNDQSAIAKLESDAWAKQLSAAQGLLDQNARLRPNLSRDIADYSRAPLRLAALARPRPMWRVYFDRLVMRFWPSSSYGRSLIAQARDTKRFKDIFLKIAAGDLDGADRALKQP